MSVTLTRELAYDAFIQVMFHQNRADTVLEKIYEKHQNLKRLDKNFIKELLYGSLRWYSKIYWILNQTAKRDLSECSYEVQTALVLGSYQIYYMDKVPDRASVNESVEYIRKKKQLKACSFVNGILRQIARKTQYFPKPDKEEKLAEYFSVQYAHPQWLIDRWLNKDEIKSTVLEKILIANNKAPTCFIRVSSLNVDDVNEFQTLMLKKEKIFSDKKWLPYTLRLKSYPSLDKDSLFSEGKYFVQNLSSQLVGAIASASPATTIVDACAGPGGKFSNLYELYDKAKLIAVEKNKGQYDRIIENMKRLNYLDDRVKCYNLDFLDFKPKEDEVPDKIVLDAPCSGLGVLASHPEGKWHKKEGIVEEFSSIQKQLIDHALSILKEEGELVYSVCSFEKEESSLHLKYIEEKYKDSVEILDIDERVSDYFKKYIINKKLFLVYPGGADDMDGFSCFVVKKKCK